MLSFSENEKSIQQTKFENECKLLIKVLALEEHYAIYEAGETGEPMITRRFSSTTKRKSLAGVFVGRQRTRSKSAAKRRRSSSMHKRSFRATSIGRSSIRNRIESQDLTKGN